MLYWNIIYIYIGFTFPYFLLPPVRFKVLVVGFVRLDGSGFGQLRC